MQLSRFFTLAELTRSDTAAREGIPNQPAEAQIDALRALCSALLDPLREAVGRPIRVTSGYRGPALNARIGGSATSQHSHGQAADLQCPGLDVLELFKTVIRLGLPYDQLIYEAQSASVKWVHVSHRAGANRGEVRVAQFNAAGRPTGYPLVGAEQALAMRERTTRSRSAMSEPGYVERADEPDHDAADAPTPATRPAETTAPATARRAAAKAPARRAAAKKAPARKAAKAAAKKAAPRKIPAKKTPAKKTPAKKTATKKAAPKQVAGKAAPAKRSGSTPASAGTPARTRKAPAQRGTARTAAAKTSPARKAAAKKTPARRATPR
ncbi:MAG: hypothetical protein KIS83_03785 [Rubrivivax sp.]|nr:hypothetical protein [Rubrivivax sp.]